MELITRDVKQNIEKAQEIQQVQKILQIQEAYQKILQPLILVQIILVKQEHTKDLMW